jgi:predicted DNA binding CopG/RHH family protein
MAVKKQDLEQEIIAKEEAYSRKDATLNMRISSRFLDDIKEAAKSQGFEKYQAWVSLALLDAVNEARGIDVEKGKGI